MIDAFMAGFNFGISVVGFLCVYFLIGIPIVITIAYFENKGK